MDHYKENTKTNYSELEKRKVKIWGTNGHSNLTKLEGAVVGCEYDIGLTIREKDSKEYLICYSGPSVETFPNDDVYDLVFHEAMKRIKKNQKIKIWELNDIIRSCNYSVPNRGKTLTSDDCAFT